MKGNEINLSAGCDALSDNQPSESIRECYLEFVRNPAILIFGMTRTTTTTIQIRGRGTLTLPAALREKYRLDEGDPLTVVDLDGAVLLSPRLLVVPRLAAEMERLRQARRLSLKELGGPDRED